MCLPVSRLFWVLSLDYPNLLGTKGYVVVVVVVVVVLSCGQPIVLWVAFAISSLSTTLTMFQSPLHCGCSYVCFEPARTIACFVCAIQMA
jgi:hypothetical protein